MSIQTIHVSRIRGLPKTNFAAITNPDNTTDESMGYTVGSIQINVDTNDIFTCVDSSINAAIWFKYGEVGTDSTITDRIDALEIDSTNHESRIATLESEVTTYHHTQLVASDTQNVVHNLNRYPTVTVVDSTMSKEEVHGTVQYIDENRLNILFGAAFTGEAFIK